MTIGKLMHFFEKTLSGCHGNHEFIYQLVNNHSSLNLMVYNINCKGYTHLIWFKSLFWDIFTLYKPLRYHLKLFISLATDFFQFPW